MIAYIFQVWEYNPHDTVNPGCCEQKSLFTELFPLHPDSIGKTYQGEEVPLLTGHVDTVYYSYSPNAMYFIKGKYVWKNILFTRQDPETGKILHNSVDQNELQFAGKSNEFWQDLCTVDLDQH